MPSPIDELYREIFGSSPNKAGTAFERLAAIATFVESQGGNITHDAALKGAASGSNYQIDVLHQSEGTTTMGEVKDYTHSGGKVGRSDLQKLTGALLDLSDVGKGVFWSATDYTKPARQYASASKSMPHGKEILLRGLRESTPTDEQGFVKTINFTGTHCIPLYEDARWVVHWTSEGISSLKALIPPGENSIDTDGAIDVIFDAHGEPLTSIFELTSKGHGLRGEDNVCRACYWLPGHYVRTNRILAPIHGLEYEIPYLIHKSTFQITDNSTHRLVVLDEDGSPVRILTDEKLREFNFAPNGDLIAPARLQRY
ncbi:restriction endonuclease [Pseudomonas juntendi]